MNRSQLRLVAVLGTLIILVAVVGIVTGSEPYYETAPERNFEEIDGSADTSEPAVYIVQLADPPIASYRGGIAGLEPTNPAVRGEVKLDVSSAASRAYLDHLEASHSAFMDVLSAQTGRNVEVKFEYFYAFNGLAVYLTPVEAADAESLPGIQQIEREYEMYIDTDAGPEWIGADHIWDGTATGGLPGTEGEGVIAGILDTGFNLDHPSFADVGGDGYDHTNPYGSGNYVGLCDSDPVTWICNDKLIGYWIFTGETTEDTDGHGTHTGTTTAGNHLTATMIISASIPVGGGFVDTTNSEQYTAAISGVAPHANVIGYDVCNDVGGCPTAGSVAAIDQAVADGVDVINFSIGGGASNPWTDSTAVAFLGASDAGIVPVTSAGNAGPGPGTIGSPNNAPWMLAVGASFHNRQFPNALINMTGGNTTPPADIDGLGFTSGYGPAPIVYAGDFGDPLCGTPFPANTWTNGEIVVCDRGTYARVEKGVNVLAGGAGGYILANASASQTLNADPHALPAVHILYDDGVALKAWMATGSGHMATIEGSTLSTDPANGDQMASFSSRGPNIIVPGVIKPDVTAPGVDILAGYKTGAVVPDNFQQEFGFISGTSMSSPHTAGAAALMRALYPGWSVAEIKSALMSTGWTNIYKEDDTTPADPFDMGGGYIDLTGAGQAGLVLDITTTDFVNANPALGGDPAALNLASMADNTCAGICSWTRTVKSTLSSSQEWDAVLDVPAGMSGSISPSNFTIPAGGTQVLTIEVDTVGMPVGDWAFAELQLTPVLPLSGLNAVPAAHMPIAVIPTSAPPGIDVNPTDMSVELPVDGSTVEELTISNIGDAPLDWSLYEDNGNAPGFVDYYEDFDSYATGSQMHGQGGWKGWGDDPTFGALTSDAQAHSAPNSVDINGLADLVHEFSGYDSGKWTITAWQYIPSSFSGETAYIWLNQYDDGGTTNNWSAQVRFNSTTGMMTSDFDGATLPFVTDAWKEIVIEVDLDSDTQSFYYDSNLLYTKSWADGVSGGGITSIGAIDLFANGATSVYYDDISIVEVPPEPCDFVEDIPWLVANPTSGTVAAGGSDVVDVTFDATGLAAGSYSGTLCVTSNDPADPLVPVPVSLTVVEDYYIFVPVILKPE